MKTSLICGAALAILGVTVAPVVAQTQTTTTSSTSTGYVQTSKIIGTKVKTAKGEEVGVVKDVVLDRNNGCMAYTVLSEGSVGTRVTGGGKLVAVPWSVYTVSPDAGYLTVNVDRQRIYDAPAFEYSRISDTSYMTNVYSHFGVSAGATFGTTTTARETTGATANTSRQTTEATANTNSAYNTSSPAESPSASPQVSPANSPVATASPGASASATASPDAKASVSPKSGSKNKGRVRSTESPSASRRNSDEANGESTSEGNEGSSHAKSSARKSNAEESSDENEGTSTKKTSHRKSREEGSSETSPTPNGEQE